MNFIAGARWSEDVAGSNARAPPGHRPRHPVLRQRHYRRPVQPWSCRPRPSRPVTGTLLGAIDVTGGDHVASPHVLTLVRATVAAVESELRWQHRDQLGSPRRRLPAAAGAAGAAARRPRPGAGAADAAHRAGRAVAAPLGAAPAARRGRGRRRGAYDRPARRRVPPGGCGGPSRCGPRWATCAAWSAPTWSARGRTACSAGSTPTSTRSAGYWPAGTVGSALERYAGAVLPASRAAGCCRGPGPRERAAPAGGVAQPSSRAAACATRSCPRPGTASPSGRPASSGCRPAPPRRAAAGRHSCCA